MDSDVQLAAFRISPTDVPIRLAFEVAVPLVECAVKVLVSIPADFMMFFSQWPIVAGVTGLCGFRTEMNNVFL